MSVSTLPRIVLDVAASAGVAFGVAMGVAAILMLTRRWHLRFSGDVLVHLSHKAHRTALPRVGGLAIVAGFVAGLCHLLASHPGIVPRDTAILLLASLAPVAACGLAEDLTKCVGPRQRLVWMSIGALFLCGSGVLVLQRTDVAPLDAALTMLPVAVVFTAFACVGAANAFNIVDGLNGLLAGIALITLAAIAWVAASVGDRVVLSLAVLLALATLGWMPFNWPRATLFAGDGGAYSIGFLTAVLLLMLVASNPTVSPWFGITAAALPVWETLFSIGRRVRSGRSALEADRAHLHQLVRERILASLSRRIAATGGPVPAEGPNGRCSPLLWLLHAGAVLPAAAFHGDTGAQLHLFVAFVLTYLLVHGALTRGLLARRFASAS